MYILAIETTGKFGSVSLIDNKGAAIGYLETIDPMSHLKNLIPMIKKLLEDRGIEKKQLTHVAVSVGPGSFTGIRIGVSTARALCQCLSIPAVAVPTLDSFLYKDEARNVRDCEIVCAIINARRNQVYGIIDGYMEAKACMISDVLEIITSKVFPKGQRVLFMGDGIDAYKGQIEESLSGLGEYRFVSEGSRYQDAESVGAMAFTMVQKGEVTCFSELLPDYMRKAEAEQKLEAGELPICKGPKQE